VDEAAEEVAALVKRQDREPSLIELFDMIRGL